MAGEAPMRRLENKIVVLAGGAGGIGTGTARRLACEGAKLLIGDLDEAAAAMVAEGIRAQGGIAQAIRCDLSDQSSVEAMFEAARRHFGGVDHLHCNAADMAVLPQDTDALDISLAVWHRTLDVTLTGYLRCTRLAIPLMLARGGGTIVYTSSGAAFVPEATRVAYSVAKTGLIALMRHVALRWGSQGIRANIVAPGLVMTPTTERLDAAFLDALAADTPAGRHGAPADIAAMVAMLMSDDGGWITGQTLSVNGGIWMR